MINADNPVVRFFLEAPLDHDPDFPWRRVIDHYLSQITEEDVLQLDETLNEYNAKSGEWAIELLADFNCRAAGVLELPSEIIWKCYQTLLRVFVAGGHMHGIALDTVIAVLDSVDSDCLGPLGCQARIEVAEQLACRREEYSQVYEYCQEAVHIAEQLEDLSDISQKLLIAQAIAKKGEIKVQVGDLHSGVSTLKKALSALPLPEGQGVHEVVVAQANIVHQIAEGIWRNQKFSEAIEHQQEAVRILRRIEDDDKDIKCEIAQLLWRLGNMLKEREQYPKVLAILQEACCHIEELELDQSLSERLAIEDLFADITEMLVDAGRKSEPKDLQEQVLREHGVEAAATAGHHEALNVLALENK